MDLSPLAFRLQLAGQLLSRKQEAGSRKQEAGSREEGTCMLVWEMRENARGAG
jgi:hypothetical protein